MKILLTGATGFVGRHTRTLFESMGLNVVPVSRRPVPGHLNLGDLCNAPAWDRILSGIDVVIHLAARVHVMRETADDPVNEFARANVLSTQRLVEACIAHRVRRVILMSTVGVYGTKSVRTVTEGTHVSPESLYAASKLEAERVLLRLTDATQVQALVLRAPLTYGPGSPGNLQRLGELVSRGVPLPLGSADNRRSAVCVTNLASALLAAASAPDLPSTRLLITDGTVWSSKEMARWVGRSVGRDPRLIPIAPALARAGLAAIGRKRLADQLFGSLEVDGSAFSEMLGWKPLITPQEALNRGVI